MGFKFTWKDFHYYIGGIFIWMVLHMLFLHNFNIILRIVLCFVWWHYWFKIIDYFYPEIKDENGDIEL